MKVVLVNTYAHTGGAAIACSRLYHALSTTGTVKASTLHLNESSVFSKYLYLFRLAIEKTYFSFYERSKEDRFKFSLANTGMDISRQEEIKNADVIHLHWINNGFLSLHSLEQLAQLKKPIVWTLHDMWTFTGGCHYSDNCDHFKQACGQCFFLKDPADNDLSHQVYLKKKALFDELDLTIVTCSHWLKELAGQSSLLAHKKIMAIPNPIDTDIYKPQSKSALRKKYGLATDKNIVLFAAANVQDSRKGFQYLLSALSLLKKRHPQLNDSTELLIIGKFNPELIQALPYPAHFPGYISDSTTMAEYYALADVFITPSIEDNLPNTVMEAMSSGTPAIAFNVGGTSDMIQHLKNGYLAQLKSTEDMAEGLYLLLSDEILRRSFGEASREQVMEKFNFPVVAQQYQSVYESLLNQ
ncbi:MAG: hypothetical protein JWO58_429 [Chitinophagaceae bacterium]|nr:hypothetical protein [Chitinophagaceae bacterium]